VQKYASGRLTECRKQCTLGEKLAGLPAVTHSRQNGGSHQPWGVTVTADTMRMFLLDAISHSTVGDRLGLPQCKIENCEGLQNDSENYVK